MNCPLFQSIRPALFWIPNFFAFLIFCNSWFDCVQFIYRFMSAFLTGKQRIMAFMHHIFVFTSWLDADDPTCSGSRCLSVRSVRFVYTISSVPCPLTSVVCFGQSMDPNIKLLCGEVGAGRSWLSLCEFSPSSTFCSSVTFSEWDAWGCKGGALAMPKLFIWTDNHEVVASAVRQEGCPKLFWSVVAEMLFWANNVV